MYSSYCQNAAPRASHWYFGNNAGFSFFDNDLSVLNDSKMEAPNGSASISDKNGNLLFYTNGETIWNASHEIMEYGDQLFGDKSLAQSSIIVPQPNNESIYFVFTLRHEESFSSSGLIIFPGLYYSIVDISLNNGKGKVLRKNLRKNGDALKASKITAVHHADGESVWLIAYVHSSDDSGEFYTYKIDDNGISSPIITPLNKNINPYYGVLKASPNGEKLILSDQNNWFLNLVDFNNETGRISSIKNVNLIVGIGAGYTSHGVEFSQDSKIAYISANINEENINYIVRLDLYSNEFEVERKIIDDTPLLVKSALQIASNGKIYRAIASGIDFNDGFQFVGAMNNPELEELKQIDYKGEAVNLGTGVSRIGLPNFIQSYFRTRIVSNKNFCVNQEFDLTIDTYSQVINPLWDFGDGNYSIDSEPVHSYSKPGNYEVNCSFELNGMSVLVEKEIMIYEYPKLERDLELVQCKLGDNLWALFNLYNINSLIDSNPINDKMVFYESRINAEGDTLRIQNADNYMSEGSKELFVRVYNEIGCYSITNVFLELIESNLGVVSNIETCGEFINDYGEDEGFFDLDSKKEEIRFDFGLGQDMIIKFYDNLIDAQKRTNELGGKYRTKTSIIWVRIEGEELSCYGIDFFNLIVHDSPKFELDEGLVLCSGQGLQEIKPFDIGGDYEFEWRDERGKLLSVNEVLSLNEEDINPDYGIVLTLRGTDLVSGCEAIKRINVKKVKPLELTLEDVFVEDMSEINNILINPQSLNFEDYQFSLDSEFGPYENVRFFEDVAPGIHTIYTRDKNNCGKSNIEVSVVGFPRFFTPNGDGVNDKWEVLGIDEMSHKSIVINIYDRFGKLVTTVDSTNEGWDGYYNGIQMPSDDYWFNAIVIDKNGDSRQQKGHFSLMRK